MTRNERILQAIDINKGSGLEIGPLASPILTKKEADIYYLDHVNNKELRRLYKDEVVDLNKIPRLDYVLNGSALPKVLKGNKFNYVLASHVIEHVPNMIGWLTEIASILEPGGILSLIIPDKRFTFDLKRRVTSPAEVMGAYFDNLQKPSSAMMYDFASACLEDVDSVEAWRHPERFIDAPGRWSLEEVREKCRKNLKPNEYVDCHCYVFTPSSFVDILRELNIQGLLDFEVVYFLETQENELEFYVSLRKSNSSIDKKIDSLPTLEGREDKLDKLEKQRDALQEEVHALKHSLSWRVTRHLRMIKKIINNKH
jgi:predicted SAM-dependent methyltransferase